MAAEVGPSGNILVIDDDPDFLRMIRSVMRHLFSSIHVARTGKEALRIAEAEPVDVILIEVEMQRECGFTLCSQLKKHPILSHRPVILISSGYNNLSVETLRACGAVDFLAKPFKTSDLHRQIQNVLESQQT